MLIHPVVQQLNSIVSIVLQPSFNGDANDATDKQRIAAYGDPKVNMGGVFVDPLDSTFTFNIMATEYWKGISTELPLNTVKFMTQLPSSVIGQPPASQGPLDCLTSDPVRAATVWTSVMQTRCGAALTTLRAKTPPQLSTLPDAHI